MTAEGMPGAGACHSQVVRIHVVLGQSGAPAGTMPLHRDVLRGAPSLYVRSWLGCIRAIGRPLLSPKRCLSTENGVPYLSAHAISHPLTARVLKRS